MTSEQHDDPAPYSYRLDPSLKGIVIALEGVDGVGKTTHTDALAAGLKRAIRAGGEREGERNVVVGKRHHVPPPESLHGNLIHHAVWFAAQRFRAFDLMHQDPTVARVDVWDRWWHSSATLGFAMRADTLERLARSEDAVWHARMCAPPEDCAGSTPARGIIPVVPVLLTATPETLAARMEARAAEGKASAVDRDANQQRAMALRYLALAEDLRWPIFRTDETGGTDGTGGGSRAACERAILRGVLQHLCRKHYLWPIHLSR